MWKKFALIGMVAVVLSACQVEQFFPWGQQQPQGASTPVPTVVLGTATKTPTPRTVPTLYPTATGVLDKGKSPTKAPADLRIQPNTGEARAYGVQLNGPTYSKNFSHPEKGCAWMGVGGLVLELDGKTVPSIVVMVQGSLLGKAVNALSMTGVTTVYGPNGYEIELAPSAVPSTGTLQMQLFDLAGQPISDPVVFNTFSDCQKNQILINFQRIAGVNRWYIPFISKVN